MAKRSMPTGLATVGLATALLGAGSGQADKQRSQENSSTPQVELANKIIGNGVFDDKCQRVGAVDHIEFDADGDLLNLVVELSGGKRVALAPSEIKLQIDQVDDKCPEKVLAVLGKDEISQKPAVDTASR